MLLLIMPLLRICPYNLEEHKMDYKVLQELKENGEDKTKNICYCSKGRIS